MLLIVHLGVEGTLETQHLPLAGPDQLDGQLRGEGGEGVGPGHWVLTPGRGKQEQTWEYAGSWHYNSDRGELNNWHFSQMVSQTL